MPKDKDRIPQVGETVYLKTDSRCTPMYLDRVYQKEKVEYGFCVWTAYELVDDDLLSYDHQKEFPLEELTVYAPDGK
jgi:hypothetical protein